MTIQAQDSVYSQVFVPRDYDVFAGLDVDHHSIAATFTDHDRLMQSLRLPYSARQLLNYVGKQFPGQRPIAALLLGLAEIEHGNIRERQKAGIEAAKARGVYTGRAVGSTKASPKRRAS